MVEYGDAAAWLRCHLFMGLDTGKVGRALLIPPRTTPTFMSHAFAPEERSFQQMNPYQRALIVLKDPIVRKKSKTAVDMHKHTICLLETLNIAVPAVHRSHVRQAKE